LVWDPRSICDLSGENRVFHMQQSYKQTIFMWCLEYERGSLATDVTLRHEKCCEPASFTVFDFYWRIYGVGRFSARGVSLWRYCKHGEHQQSVETLLLAARWQQFYRGPLFW